MSDILEQWLIDGSWDGFVDPWDGKIAGLFLRVSTTEEEVSYHLDDQGATLRLKKDHEPYHGFIKLMFSFYT